MQSLLRSVFFRAAKRASEAADHRCRFKSSWNGMASEAVPDKRAVLPTSEDEDAISLREEFRGEQKDYSKTREMYAFNDLTDGAQPRTKEVQDELDKMLEKIGMPHEPPRSVFAYFLRNKRAPAAVGTRGIVYYKHVWENLPKEEKDEYVARLKAEHENYEKEMTEWLYRMGINFCKWEKIQNEAEKKLSRYTKHCKKPIEPPTAMSLFIQDREAELGVNKLPKEDMEKEWNELSSDEREKYCIQAKELYEKYEKRYENWEKTITSVLKECIDEATSNDQARRK